MIKFYHPFHIITPSPWPILNAIVSWNIVSYILWRFSTNIKINLLLFNIIIITSAFLWWLNIIKETTEQGSHFFLISNGLKIGIILFITSEVLFFFSFFWAYFHSSISPNIEIGLNWPPIIINTFNPINVPLLNTIILVSSGVTVTWAHNELIKINIKKSNFSLTITCTLGIYFSILQTIEYIQAEFSISDSSYGSTFFIATGFHGIHVIIGTTFLRFMLYRTLKTNSNTNRIIGFEIAAWYWHFVDLVWLFLYLSIYWWSY